MLAEDPELNAIRIIYFRNLVDWASQEAEKVNAQVMEFVGSPTFVDYPDFLTNEKIMTAVKQEWIQDHSIQFNDLSGYEAEILGVRIGTDGNVEVLILSNQVKYDPIYRQGIVYSRKKYSIPPKVTIGHLKRNPLIGHVRGQGNELYIVMKAPYQGRNGEDAYVEAVIPEHTSDQEQDEAQ